MTLLPLPTRCLLWLLPALLLFSRAIADVTVVLISLSFLYRSGRDHDWSWMKQAWILFTLPFWAYLLLLNVAHSVSPFDSLKYALTFIRWPLFAAALAYWLLKDKLRQIGFLQGLLVTMLLIVADTGWQYLFGTDWFGIERFTDDRLTGPFRNPVPGTLMLRVWFIGLFAVMFWQTSKPRAGGWHLYLLYLFIGLVFTFITGERMALMLFVAASMLVILALYLDYPGKRHALILGVALIVLCMWGLMQTLPGTTERSVMSIADKLAHFVESDYGQVFSAAWQVWQQHFWLGSGIHGYQQACEQMGLFADSAMQCTHAHNLYLQLGAETGLVGVCLFVLMLGAIYWQALSLTYKNRHWTLLALSLSVLSVSFWPLMGGISVLNNWVGALVWLGVGWVLAVSATSPPSLSRQKAVPDH